MKSRIRTAIVTLMVGMALGILFGKVLDIKVSIRPYKMALKKLLYSSKSNTQPKRDTLELCAFENKSDIRKIEKQGVTIVISDEKASEGKTSLKCEFPDGGGAIGFYDTFPSDWTGYKKLAFDVYSEDEGLPLSLFIADTNNTSYYDRFNRENIALKNGWNAIEIPISDIDKKLILDRVNHLRVFLWQVSGSHVLYIDNIRLTSSNESITGASVSGPIEIIIDPSKEKAKISRLLYGSNLCHKAESDQDIMKFVKNIGITCFRYPGGGSPGWHWKTGVADFSGKVKDMPLANIDYLIEFCKRTNTQIIMQVNIESGTPQEAAELVTYMNKTKGFRVDYWELGNEAYGDWDKAFTTPDKYAETINEYSAAMKAADPDIKIGADWGETYYDRVKWDETLIKKAADHIDFVSIHWYPNHISNNHVYEGRVHPEPEEVMSNAMQVPNIVNRVKNIIERNAPHRKGKVEVAFLEWDGSWDAPSNDPPPFTRDAAMWSLANAIFYADTLGQFAENGVAVSAQYSLQECMFGLIRGWDPAEGWGGQEWDLETIRPKAYAIQLFSKHFGDILIESTVKNSLYYHKKEDWWPSSYTGTVPYITCYASKFSDKNSLAVIVINKHHDQAADIKISIKEPAAVAANGSIWILTGPAITSQNDGTPYAVKINKIVTDMFGNQFTMNIPAHSVVAMEIVLQ